MLLTLNFIALRLLLMFLPAGFGIVAENNVPEVLPIGETVSVRWAVHKGDLDGFAKLTLDVPPFLEVDLRSASGATFSFEGQQAKLIWMDMPVEATLAVGLDFTALPGFEGGDIRPVFSFVRSGDRVDLALEAAHVRPDPKTMPLGVAHYHGKRHVDVQEGGEHNVRLQIACEPTAGFLKIEEELPAGCRVEVTESMGATTSVLNDVLKFVWFEAPDVEGFDLHYVLHCESIVAEPWQGHIAYVSANEPQKKTIVQMAWAGEDFAEVAQHAHSAADTDGHEETEENQDERKEKDDAAQLSRSSSPSLATTTPDLDYRVQVMAAHRYVDGEWMENRFGLKAQIDVEEDQDWYKYTTGQAKSYASARNLRQDLMASYNFPGPFVTAYLLGERITVQEALALSAQQWIP